MSLDSPRPSSNGEHQNLIFKYLRKELKKQIIETKERLKTDDLKAIEREAIGFNTKILAFAKQSRIKFSPKEISRFIDILREQKSVIKFYDYDRAEFEKR